MNLLGLNISLSRKAEAVSIDTILRRLEAINETISGVSVTPESAMQSPTVYSLVNGVSKRMAALSIQVIQKQTDSNGRPVKTHRPDHPAAKLLNRPNGWQTRTDFILDATSTLLRHGNYYAFKAQGRSGPIRELIPLPAGAVEPVQADDWSVTFKVNAKNGEHKEFQQREILHCRGPARDGVKGDSPVMDVREAIALEIAAEKFGASFFGNGAMPGIIFKFVAGFQGFRTDEERKKFVEDFQSAYTHKGRFRSLLLPNGMEVDQSVAVENDKAQFLETRKLQRSIIAGAWGIPPHLVGDLDRATFSNIEEQSLEFVQSVILPYARMLEASFERSLLAAAEVDAGFCIRFNLDAALRGKFEDRQRGLQIQRQAGVISANEWREREGLNPREGGDSYFEQGPSGQTDVPSGAQDEGQSDDEQV